MDFPSFGEYADALRLDLATALSDPLLRRGTVRMRGPGQPVVHGGTFALTFEIMTDAGRFALRCFHRELDALQLRYGAIEQRLAEIQSRRFVDLNFQPLGITTRTGTYPVVRMDWAEGPSLAAYVTDHREDPVALQLMRLALRRLAQDLRSHGIAHGDIQPSNIIVQPDTMLRLIDYDGMFVPELTGLASAELGQRNFQHPRRRAIHFDEHLDAFSFAVIDLALHALCLRPDLWERTGSGADAFLLRAADFMDPASSEAFGLLSHEAGLEEHTRRLASVCVSPFEAIPSFEDFLAGREIPVVAVDLPGRHGATTARPAYVPPYRVADAADFEELSRHVGERVEVVGQVARVTRCSDTETAASCLRIELAGPASHDTCLRIWQDTAPLLDAPPDESWAGQWISAVGLIEPVTGDVEGGQGPESVSVSITDWCQLQRLPEAEATYRLRAAGQASTPSLDSEDWVWTDPVVPARAAVIDVPRGNAMPVPGTSAVAVSPAETGIVPALEIEADLFPVPEAPVLRYTRRAVERRRQTPWARISRWLPWVAAAVAVVLAAYALLWRDAGPERMEAVAGSGTDSRPAALPLPPAPAPTPEVPTQLEFVAQRALGPSVTVIETLGGTLSIASDNEGRCRKEVRLRDVPVAGLCDDVIVLEHRAVFSDRDVVVGFTRCENAAAPCSHRRPFWLELRAGAAPLLRRPPDGIWAGGGKTAVSASSDGVQVDLGLWNGANRRATLNAAGGVVLERLPEPSRRLDRADCAVVVRSLEFCAASRDCSTFASSAERIPASNWQRLSRMYHETTGLDAESFRKLCQRSCELHLTPSAGLIRRYACNGASPDQWPADDAGAGL